MGNRYAGGDAAVKIFPAGKQVLYSKPRTDWVKNKVVREIWIADANGESNRKFAEGGGASWSPDGRHIAYIAATENGAQILIAQPQSPEDVVSVTPAHAAPASFAWSPDSTHIAYTGFAPSEPAWVANLPKPEGAHWGPDPVVSVTNHGRLDSREYLQGYTHLFVVDIASQSVRKLTHKDRNHVGATWSADGKKFLSTGFLEGESEPTWFQSRVYEADVKSGK